MMSNSSDCGFFLHFEKVNLKFKIRNTNMAERWYGELLSAIDRNDFCEKDRLYNFNETTDEIMNDLLHSAEMINSWKPIIDLSSHDMNHLHKYFEIMMGSSEKPAKYFLDAPKHVRKHILRYNILIHKIEAFDSGIKRIVVRSESRKRFDLNLDDYKLFETHRKYGTVYINYCHVGKPLYDVFKDEDHIVGDHNIVPQSKYSSDMCILFSDEKYQMDKFFEWFDRKSNWLNSLGFYKNDPKIAIGSIPVADLVTDMDRESIIELISQHKEYKTVTAW